MDQQQITVFAKWQVTANAIDTVLHLLKEVVQKSTAEEGNLFYKVHQSQSDTHTLVLYEGYRDEEALAAHRESAHFQALVIGQIVPLLQQREVTITRLVISQ